MAWTNISKPTGSSYTNVNTAKPSYDESSLTYDSSSQYYDGVDSAAWNNLAKPTSSGWTSISKPT